MLKINLWILFSCAIVIGITAFLTKNNDHYPGLKTFKNKKTSSDNSKSRDYSGVPEWYLHDRVQIFVNLQLKDINTPDFFDFPKELAQNHVTVLTREIKSWDEEPWWPSKVGTMNPLTTDFNKNGENLAKKIILQMHDLNMKAIVYYRHSEDSEMMAKHPEWVCLNENGKPIKGARGYMLSLNSPYRDVVMTRLKELASYGADGFYFDYFHITLGGDFSPYSQKLYEKEYGTSMLKDFKSNKLQVDEFINNTIDRFFTDVRTSLLPYKPILLVSGDNWTNLTGLHMNSEFFEKFILKTELEEPARIYRNTEFPMPADVTKSIPGFYLNAFFFSFMRDNSGGPPNVWCPGIRSAEDANNIAAGVISLGGIANLDVAPGSNKSRIAYMEEPLKWNSIYGDYFKDLIPYASYGILASENERNKYLSNPDEAWQQVLIPAINTFSKLYKAGIPVDIVSDATLNTPYCASLDKIYCNKSLTLAGNANLSENSNLADFSSLENLDGIHLAMSLKTPLFADKTNEFVHINYFKDKKGYIYAIAAPDFKSVIKGYNERMGLNLLYQQSPGYNAAKNFQLYIKKENILSGQEIENITDNSILKPVKIENGYFVFSVPYSNSLLMLRFKSNL